LPGNKSIRRYLTGSDPFRIRRQGINKSNRD